MLTDGGRSPPYDPTNRLRISLVLSAKEVAAMAKETISAGSTRV